MSKTPSHPVACCLLSQSTAARRRSAVVERHRPESMHDREFLLSKCRELPFAPFRSPPPGVFVEGIVERFILRLAADPRLWRG